MKTTFTFLACLVCAFARAQVDFAAPIMHAGIAAQTASVSVPAPYAWYKLDGNAIDSEGLNNGTLQGSPTFVSGLNGHQAISLSGTNQYVSLGTMWPGMSTNTNCAVSAWVYNTNLPSNTGSFLQEQYIYSFGQGAQVGIQADSVGAEWGSEFQASGGYPEVKSAFNYINNNWHFICGEYNGQTLILGVDGTYYSMAETQIPNANPSLGGAIGEYPGTGLYWHGEIQDVRIWTNSLTEAQMTAVYQAGAQ